MLKKKIENEEPGVEEEFKARGEKGQANGNRREEVFMAEDDGI